MKHTESLWTEALIDSSYTLLQVMELLNQTQLQIAMLVDSERKLAGVICDGDIRRGLLKGVAIVDNIQADGVINKKPITISPETSESEILKIFEEEKITRLPILDSKGVVVGLAKLEDFLSETKKSNPVVVMAGGEGKRLMPLTQETPKPMLHVGDKPILEIILENFKSHGFYNFYFCVNYQSAKIKEYFGSGDKWDVSIQYIEECKPLGTAGALKLLPEVAKPAIITNGDILTKLNFSDLLSHHHSKDAVATMCVKEYEHKIPYGVIRTDEDKIIGLEEKPVHRFFVNAGMYVVNPKLLQGIPGDETYNITDLFSRLIEEECTRTTVFPVHEYWLDIGRVQDYEKAQKDYERLFR